MTKIRDVCVLSLLAAAAMGQADTPSLAIGSPAPSIHVLKWAKGTPITKFEKGKIYVVEFWATWCGPCKVSIPHLTELAKKYAGKVTFAGVDVWEHDDDDATCTPMVTKFIRNLGDKMNYNVAIDGSRATMAKTWMDAAKEDGIPTAFVVDGAGTVAWIGQPMAGLEEVLDRILDGSYDRKAEIAAKAQAVADRKKQEGADASAPEMAAKEAELVRAVLAAAAQKRYPQAVAAIERVVALDPSAEVGLGPTKFLYLCQFDAARAKLYARKLMKGIFQDQPDTLNEMADKVVDPGGDIVHPDLSIAVELAETAAEISENDPIVHAGALSTLATAYSRQGDYEKAISTQEAAVKIAVGDPGFPAEVRADIKANLASLKKHKKPW